MRPVADGRCRRRGKRWAAGLMLAAMLAGSAGLKCDSEASATFRKTAVGPIGDGVRSIMDGVLDGMIAAIEDAGDDSSSDDGTATNGSSTSGDSSTNGSSSSDTSSSGSSSG